MAGYASLDPYAKARYDHGIDAKIVVMGNTGVGKTSLLQRYTQNKFDPKNTTATTGAFFVTKKVYVGGCKVRLQLWDTAGQERFRSMAPMYYRGANAALLLYDITNASTFEDVRGWLEELKKNCGSEMIIYIVGSKADLSRSRQVTPDRVRLSLARWFPPPRPPTPPTPPPPQPSTLSYIRPRFTSFTTSRSVPVNQLAPKALDDNALSNRPSELRRSITGIPRARNGKDSDPAVPAAGAQGLRRANSQNAASSPQRAKLFERPLHLPPTPASSGLSRLGGSLFGVNGGLHQGVFVDTLDGSSNSVPEEIEDEDDSDGTEWGLEKGMSLFEVSAKDGGGVKQLFDELISEIMLRKDNIEKENEMKKRDSVMLSPSLTPSWTAQAEQEEKALQAASSNPWSCCSG